MRIIFVCFVMVFLAVPNAWAGGVEADVNVSTGTDQSQWISQSETNNVWSRKRQDFIPITPFLDTGANNVPVQPKWGRQGSQTWLLLNAPELTIGQLKNLAKNSPLKKKNIQTAAKNTAAEKLEKDDIVMLLPWEIKEKERSVSSFAVSQGNPDVSAARVLLSAAEASGSLYCHVAVEWLSASFTTNDASAAGAVISFPFFSNNETAGAAGGNKTNGATSAWLDDRGKFNISVVCYDSVSEADLKVPEPERRLEEKEIMARFYFDTDKAELSDNLLESPANGQLALIKRYAEEINRHKGELISKGKEIWFLGHCDERASVQHNLDIGRRRAKNLSEAVSMELMRRGWKDEEIKQAIHYASADEHHPQPGGMEKSRMVKIVVATEITQ